jgi:hypothetical protein
MAYYLVTARPDPERLEQLRGELDRGAFIEMEPFGRELSRSLAQARVREDGLATWEEEDYCRPPLAQERAAVLDHYFTDLEVEPVDRGSGWAAVRGLPHLLPDLTRPEGTLSNTELT